MKNFLQVSEIIDYSNPEIQALAVKLSEGTRSDVEIAKHCFEYVRDHIRHSGDYKENLTTCKASDVLKHKTGWCYAKSHLLAALLRANGIPTGFCYQRLSCGEYKDDIYCLHGLNAIYLKDYGWYRVDARGNKEGVDAQFDPPNEKLAFALGENEYDMAGIYESPLQEVIDALQTYGNYDEMIDHFPDTQQFVCRTTQKDAKSLSRISTSLLTYIFESDVPGWFSKDFDVESFRSRIENSRYKHFGYLIDNKIVGYIAIRDDTHLYNLFVDDNYHKQGVAKKLWEAVKETIKCDTMTTNSSLYAIKVYESLGFRSEGDVQTYNTALHYQPMVYQKDIL